MDNEKPTQEELQAILEELFDRATEHNEQLQKQLAHVRSRVVQLVNENNRLVAAREYQSSCLYESFRVGVGKLQHKP